MAGCRGQHPRQVPALQRGQLQTTVISVDMAHWHEADHVPVSYYHVTVVFTCSVTPLNGTCLTSEPETGSDYMQMKASLSRGISLNIYPYHSSPPNILRVYLVNKWPCPSPPKAHCGAPHHSPHGVQCLDGHFLSWARVSEVSSEWIGGPRLA